MPSKSENINKYRQFHAVFVACFPGSHLRLKHNYLNN